MKMDELIDELNGWGEEVPIGLSMLIGKLVDCALARDAERTTLVTPEWLDGPEGKRLGFEAHAVVDGAWNAQDDEGRAVHVVLDPNGGGIEAFDGTGSCVSVLDGHPTIAQVRDAVRLFTGRE